MLHLNTLKPHEGKNVSDALGSIIKNKVRIILAEYPHGVRSSAEIVELLSIMPAETDKFSFIVVEDFKEISCILAEERKEIVQPNIMKLHSIKVVKGCLRGREQTCVQCTPSQLCVQCAAAPPTITVQDDGREDTDDIGERFCDAEHKEVSDEGSDTDDDHNATDYTSYAQCAQKAIIWNKFIYPQPLVGKSQKIHRISPIPGRYPGNSGFSANA